MSCRFEDVHIDDVLQVLREEGACCVVCDKGGNRLCKDAARRTEIMLAAAEMLERLMRERDALLADLRDAEIASCDCLHCAHFGLYESECSTECDTCELACRCKECFDNGKWEWRGVQED